VVLGYSENSFESWVGGWFFFLPAFRQSFFSQPLSFFPKDGLHCPPPPFSLSTDGTPRFFRQNRVVGLPLLPLCSFFRASFRSWSLLILFFRSFSPFSFSILMRFADPGVFFMTADGSQCFWSRLTCFFFFLFFFSGCLSQFVPCPIGEAAVLRSSIFFVWFCRRLLPDSSFFCLCFPLAPISSTPSAHAPVEAPPFFFARSTLLFEFPLPPSQLVSAFYLVVSLGITFYLRSPYIPSFRFCPGVSFL